MGLNAVSSIGFTGATILIPLILKPEDRIALLEGGVSVLKHPFVLTRKQKASERQAILVNN
jgi:hypothetical protein